MRLLLVLTLIGFLAACTKATPYQPINGGQYGYRSYLLEDNRARIVFRGNSVTDRQTVENYLLFRAAQVTLENGYDYFLTADQTTRADTELRQYGGGYWGSPAFYGPLFYDYRFYSPTWGWRPYYDPFFADPIRFREVTRFEATAEILMRRGEEPEGEPKAYDAREVIQYLRDQVRLPEDKRRERTPS